jgi:uncharacterized NAD(P)/FAD-binding protein YdhS
MSKTIAIIGGGVSGALVVLNILKQSKRATQILWFDAKNAFCKGLAYSTDEDVYLLNVRASNMSVFVDEPLHFVNWLTQQQLPFSSQDFVSRTIYGQYVSSTFNELKDSHATVKITCLAEEVTTINKNGDEFLVSAKQDYQAQQVVLAFGNFLPAHPRSIHTNFQQSNRYFQNAFSSQVITQVINQESVLIVGSGLTMIDVVLSLKKHHYTGKITAISPHGYLPQAHIENPLPTTASYINEQQTYTLLQLYSLVNQQLKFARANQLSTHSVIDTLRPHLQRLWLGLSLEDKQQFLRHLRHKWGVARHRVASQSMQVIKELLHNKQLELIRGRVLDIRSNETGFDIQYSNREQESNHLQASVLINCTGPESNFEKVEIPLIKQLLQAKIICTDALKYGIEASINGQITPNLFTIGPPLKGILWESTAVPEIRLQAQQLALLLTS